MSTLHFILHARKFTVGFEWNPTLTSYPVQFIYQDGRRVGLFNTNDDFDTSYFDSVTMCELFGQEFNVDNFGIGITFGKFNSTGLTTEECNQRKQLINTQLKSADEVFQSYLAKDLELK
jgi:hypothetical protein